MYKLSETTKSLLPCSFSLKYNSKIKLTKSSFFTLITQNEKNKKNFQWELSFISVENTNR